MYCDPRHACCFGFGGIVSVAETIAWYEIAIGVLGLLASAFKKLHVSPFSVVSVIYLFMKIFVSFAIVNAVDRQKHKRLYPAIVMKAIEIVFISVIIACLSMAIVYPWEGRKAMADIFYREPEIQPFFITGIDFAYIGCFSTIVIVLLCVVLCFTIWFLVVFYKCRKFLEGKGQSMVAQSAVVTEATRF
ncbi:hypothetical protein QR680_004087 [Steinernema hermaphroditum]|uniref:Uncharacterized protein n=1 Tax=Steinernema hermaphroditum TaxID=289476 RepID=A0AA39HMM2_9BILA|nr:hypothetical protein QR680_004087 [Steinernema hermaphroditum]